MGGSTRVGYHVSSNTSPSRRGRRVAPDEVSFDEHLFFQSDWTFARPRPFEQLSHTALPGGGPPVRRAVTH